MTFKTYLAESEKVYNYRIKAAFPIDKDVVGRIENYLKKFRVVSVSKPTKTILQKHPMDFVGITNVEVFIVDVVTSLPISSFVMRQDLKELLGVPEKMIVVRSENDPLEYEGNRISQENEIRDEAEKKGMAQETLLSTDSGHPDAENGVDGSNYYGDSYNSRLLKYVKEVDAEKQPQKVDAPASLFKWLDMPKETQEPVQPGEDFNAAIAKTEIKKADKEAKVPSANGNFDDESTKVKKAYKTKSGTSKTMTGEPTNVRKV